jgi:hypothetical protein
MRETGLYDANMVAWERLTLAEPRYEFLFIDEVQDVTTVELQLALATLRDKRNFFLCGDSNQIVHPNLFSWARVKSLFCRGAERGEAMAENIHVLSANCGTTPGPDIRATSRRLSASAAARPRQSENPHPSSVGFFEAKGKN